MDHRVTDGIEGQGNPGCAAAFPIHPVLPNRTRGDLHNTLQMPYTPSVGPLGSITHVLATRRASVSPVICGLTIDDSIHPTYYNLA